MSSSPPVVQPRKSAWLFFSLDHPLDEKSVPSSFFFFFLSPPSFTFIEGRQTPLFFFLPLARMASIKGLPPLFFSSVFFRRQVVAGLPRDPVYFFSAQLLARDAPPFPFFFSLPSHSPLPADEIVADTAAGNVFFFSFPLFFRSSRPREGRRYNRSPLSPLPSPRGRLSLDRTPALSLFPPSFFLVPPPPERKRHRVGAFFPFFFSFFFFPPPRQRIARRPALFSPPFSFSFFSFVWQSVVGVNDFRATPCPLPPSFLFPYPSITFRVIASGKRNISSSLYFFFPFSSPLLKSYVPPFFSPRPLGKKLDRPSSSSSSPRLFPSRSPLDCRTLPPPPLRS